MANRVAIIGSRTFPNLDAVTRYVAELPEGTIVVSGGAIGVDETAEIEAKRRGLTVIVHRPMYKVHGRRAPLYRNELIVRDADRVVAFHDGKSTGTLHAIGEARKAGKPVVVIGPDGEVRGG
jgi:predicted Rossmann fold nucleotide-binding protein DprA/Smf involved in DNA uptake